MINDEDLGRFVVCSLLKKPLFILHCTLQFIAAHFLLSSRTTFTVIEVRAMCSTCDADGRDPHQVPHLLAFQMPLVNTWDWSTRNYVRSLCDCMHWPSDILFHVQSWTGLLIVGLVFVYHYLVTDPKLQRP